MAPFGIFLVLLLEKFAFIFLTFLEHLENILSSVFTFKRKHKKKLAIAHSFAVRVNHCYERGCGQFCDLFSLREDLRITDFLRHAPEWEL